MTHLARPAPNGSISGPNMDTHNLIGRLARESSHLLGTTLEQVLSSGQMGDFVDIHDPETNRFPYCMDGKLNITLNAVVVPQHLFEFQEDREIATSCEKEFRFGVRTPAHLAAVQLGLLASGDDEDVVLHGCPIP